MKIRVSCRQLTKILIPHQDLRCMATSPMATGYFRTAAQTTRAKPIPVVRVRAR